MCGHTVSGSVVSICVITSTGLRQLTVVWGIIYKIQPFPMEKYKCQSENMVSVLRSKRFHNKCFLFTCFLCILLQLSISLWIFYKLRTLKYSKNPWLNLFIRAYCSDDRRMHRCIDGSTDQIYTQAYSNTHGVNVIVTITTPLINCMFKISEKNNTILSN